MPAASRKTYILVCCEDGEPTLVQPYHTLGDAAARFRAILDEEPDFRERASTGGVPLSRIVAKASNMHGDLVLLLERAI